MTLARRQYLQVFFRVDREFVKRGFIKQFINIKFSYFHSMYDM